MKTLVISILCMPVLCAAGAVCAGNPYSIAGGRQLKAVGMPEDCSEYDWNILIPDNPIQMVRPINEGMKPLSHRYDRDARRAYEPDQFAAWVAANPGKIWIIGNEPENPDQSAGDDQTIPQYVEMFQYYYTTIRGIDPSAKFAIAGSLGGSTHDRYLYSIKWLQDVMDEYRSRYGTRIPIDIWNVHSYAGPMQIQDPDKIIDEFVNPFVEWCHSVENGAYAHCDVWITELPFGEWMGSLSEDNIIWFMRHLMPRLERTGVKKWFWFVSTTRPGDMFFSVALASAGKPTRVGEAYAALAKGYPNPIPPVEPFVPDPAPGYFGTDFSGEFGKPWFNKAGWWSISDGTLRHTSTYPWWGTICHLYYDYQDCAVSFKMKVNEGQTDDNWGGLGMRVSHPLQSAGEAGYLLYVRKNGEVGLVTKEDGKVASVPNAVTDADRYHNYRVTISGFNIKVWIDDSLVIDWTDENERYAHGLIGLQVGKADVTFDDFHVVRYPTPGLVVTGEGSKTNDPSLIKARWKLDGDESEVRHYEYAIGTSPGAADVLDWTRTFITSFNAHVDLTPGTTYYVSVRTVYQGGFMGAVGTSDGILASAR